MARPVIIMLVLIIHCQVGTMFPHARFMIAMCYSSFNIKYVAFVLNILIYLNRSMQVYDIIIYKYYKYVCASRNLDDCLMNPILLCLVLVMKLFIIPLYTFYHQSSGAHKFCMQTFFFSYLVLFYHHIQYIKLINSLQQAIINSYKLQYK